VGFSNYIATSSQIPLADDLWHSLSTLFNNCRINTDEWNFLGFFNLYELIIHLLCLGIADSRPCQKAQLLLYEKQQQQ
jgi:hypothetical protein